MSEEKLNKPFGTRRLSISNSISTKLPLFGFKQNVLERNEDMIVKESRPNIVSKRLVHFNFVFSWYIINYNFTL